MTFGNAAWGFRETPLEKQLEITREMGLSVLELGIANAPGDIKTGDNTCEVTKLYKKYGINLICAATGNDFTNGNTDDIKKLKDVTDMCNGMGIKFLRIFAGFTPYREVTDKAWENMVFSLNEIYSYAESKNVVPVVETHGGVESYSDGVVHFHSTTTHPETLMKLIHEVPKIKINYDPANLYAVGIEKPEEIYETIKDKVCCIHLKDFVKTKSGHLLPSSCGESNMNWTNILKPLENFEGPLLFEYENTEDIKDGLKRCYEFIKNKIKEI